MLIFIGFSFTAFSQTYLMNGTTNGTTVNTCAGTIYDSGGAAGTFQNSEDYTLTICSNAGSSVILSITAFNTESGCDFLSIYDGNTTGDPILVQSSGSPGIQGQTFESTGTCITLNFSTDGSVTYAGFQIAISCGIPCQDYTIDIISSTPQPTDTNALIILACQNTPFSITAQGTYPNNNTDYLQSDATTDWHWSILTSSGTDEVVGGNVLNTYQFDESGIYYLNLTAVDINGCEEVLIDARQVWISVSPTFTGTLADDYVVCSGEPVELTGFVQVEEWILTIPELITDTVCFDDNHYQVPQGASFIHNAFAPGQVITSVNDIEEICMTLEHSYIGDLDLWVECPNGNIVQFLIYPNGCSADEFGDALDEYDDSAPAIDCDDPSTIGPMYQYCWSPTGVGTIEDQCGGSTTIPAGTYAAEGGTFTNLIGCPLNGAWSIWAQDNLYSDDGAAAQFELHFADYIIPTGGNLLSFQNTYDLTPTSTTVEWTGENMASSTGTIGNANPLTPGDQIYTFTVTDNFGCSYDTTLTITVLPLDDPTCCVFPTTTAGPDDHVCTNTYTFNATLATGNTGTWTLISGPGTVSWANQNSPHAIVTVNGWGSYEFEWTEQNLAPTCADADRVIIEFYPMPTTTFTHDLIACNGDHTILTYIGNMSASATFTWDFDGATVVSGSGIGPYEIYWSTAATHSVALQVSENGCDSPDTLVNIINPELLAHTLVFEDDPCFGSCEGRAEITPTGGTLPYDYSWTSPTNILPNLCAGAYSITVTDINGCTTAEDFVINEPPAIIINSIVTTNLSCYQSNDGTITVDAIGGAGTLTYQWSDIGAGTAARIGTSAGNYCVTVEDENGCSISECVELTQPDELIVTISPNTAICEGTQTTIQANGMGGTIPYTYLWDQGSGFNPASSSLTLTPDTTTTYSVYIQDANNCISNTASMIVTVSPMMVIDSIITVDNRCFNSCDGRAEIVMHGGIGPLQYSWGSPNYIYEGLCAGIYGVTVNDIIGCTVSDMFVINQPTQITYTSSTQAASCNGYADGEATIYVQGGVPPFEYLWPNGHDTETLTTIAGVYTVTVEDDHDCQISAQYTITQPTAIIVIPVGNRTICNGQSTTLNSQATGGTPYYDFHWTGSDGSIYNSNEYEVTPDQTTTYTLVVTDSHGCSSTPIYSTITVNPDLQIMSVVTSNDTICPGDPAIIHVDALGGNGGPYFMTLQDGRVVPSPFTVNPDTTTMYYVRLEDMCGTPSVVDSILINVRPKPGNVFIAEDVDGCPPFTAYFTESTPDYGQTYLWDFGNNDYSTEKNPVFIYDDPGVFSVSLEVRDFFGCKTSRTVENMITVYQGTTALFEANPEIVSMLAAEVEFINHSVDASRYYWFFGDGDSSLFVSPRHLYPSIGEYEVILVAETDNNCADTTSRLIIVRNEFAFYMPTSFTPNGDGMNDCVRPCGNGIDKNNFSMVIYDRWGSLVFDTEKFDPDVPCDACTDGSWDGTDMGSRSKGDEILPNGMYHWYAEFKDWNGTVFKEQGTITLVR